MAEDTDDLQWKFLTFTTAQGTIMWGWQLWTASGQYIESSERQFETLAECTRDAMMNGYLASDGACS